MALAGVLVGALAGVLGGCAQVAGLDGYSPGDASAGGGAGSNALTPASDGSAVIEETRDGSVSTSGDANAVRDATVASDAGPPADTGPPEAGPLADVGEAEDSASPDSEPGEGDDAAGCPASTPTRCDGVCVDEQTSAGNCGGCGASFACASGQACVSGQCLGCGTTCPLSTATQFACAAGGCNTAGGACTAAGQSCHCATDSQCKSGACVPISGENDVSCGSSCTGTGAADGFGCALVAPGIPAACMGLSFGYSPSNFAPRSYTPPSTSTTINCNTTYSSTSHTFTGWCSGQTAPTIYPSVAQASGHVVDLLAFAELTIDAGDTLTLTGSNPVILAVYGSATIGGVIDASAQGSTPGAGATACAVGTSGGGASGASYTAGMDTSAAGGGGGGLAVAGGAGDSSSYNGVDGGPTTGTDSDGTAGGGAHGGSSVVPLSGGCPGGAGAAGTAGNAGGAGGAGGGGVQLSVAGTISGTGTIEANGSAAAVGASVSPAVATNDGAGGGGGGSGGDILIESSGSNPLAVQASGGPGGAGGTGYGADTTSANTWSGFAGGNGGTNTGGSTAIPTNGGPPTLRGKSYSGGGGGGGGGYGWIKVNSGGSAPAFTCATTLSPAPVCNAAHTECLCVADSDCSSGKCVNASSQCTGGCSGSGAADGTACQVLASVATAWSCTTGACDTVTAPGGACGGAGIPCWCTTDSQCGTGHCAAWAGCSSGACTGSGIPDGMNCTP